MLDTGIVSAIIRDPAGRAAQRAKAEAATVGVSILVAAELRYGCEKKGSEALTNRVQRLLSVVQVLPFDQRADRAYDVIRATLERAGQPIGPKDLLIAAHAVAVGSTIVTVNTREFERVGGLEVENWRD